MNPEDLVQYRLARAREALQEASELLEAGHRSTAVSRCYYACFYVVGAYLAKEDMAAKGHKGQLMIFDQSMVKSGIVPVETARIYRRLFNERHKLDYADFIEATEEEASNWLVQASTFVRFITNLLGTVPDGSNQENKTENAGV